MQYRKFLIASLVAVSALACKPATARQATDTTPSFTGKQWRLQEMRFLQNNTTYYYKQSDPFASNIDLGGDYLQFESDGTGIYHMGDGTDIRLAWKYVNAEKTAIDYRLQKARQDQPAVIHWEHISVSGNGLSYAEYYTHRNGVHSVGYGTRSSGKDKDAIKTVKIATEPVDRGM